MYPLTGPESTSSMTLRGFLSRAVLLAACALTAGCSMQNFRGLDHGSTTAAVGPRLTGRVHGGQQPVSGATVQLWQVGTTGYGAGATALGSPAVSAGDGSFSITGNYSCTNGTAGDSTLVYITATGGNPGLAYGSSNSALAMMTGLGACGNLSSSTFISINEVTTVASVYALSQFMNASGAVGSYGTANRGLANAFASIGNLVDTGAGMVRVATPAGNGIVPTAEVNTLADILAPCINSSGPSSTPCAMLFTTVAAGSGGAPVTTIGAALSIALNPGYNVSALLQLQTAVPPFQPTVSSANDLTVAIAYSVGGASPASLAIDAAGRVWVANYGSGGASSSVSLLSTTGTPGANSPYQNAAINGAGALAADLNGNVWLVDRDTNSAVQLAATGTNPLISIAAGPFSGLNAPSSVAVDASSNVWITNKGNNSLTELFGSNYSATPGIYTGLGLSSPASLAFDDAGYAWVGNPGSASVLRLVTAASPVTAKAYPSSGAHPAAVAIDAASNVWVTDTTANSVTELNSSGAAVSPAAGYTGGGLTSSSANAIDGVGNLWVADATGNALTVVSASGSSASPAGGYKGGSVSAPSAIAIDGSGNLWLANGSPTVSNGSSLGVTEFIGLASPVVTPLAVAAKQRQLGQRPGTPASTTTANAGGPYSGTLGAAIAFDGSQSTAPGGQTLTYAWSFGDGAFGAGVNPTHTYSAAGMFTASLTVTATNGVTSTATATVMIGVFPPVITSFTPSSGPIGTTVTVMGSNLAPPTGQATSVTLAQQGGGTLQAPVTSNSATTLQFLIPPGAATGLIGVTVGPNSTSSAAPLTVTTSSTYALTISPANATLLQGSSTALAIALNSTNSYTGLASLSLTGLPSGITASFQPPNITAGQTSVLTLTAPAGQTVGAARLTVTAASSIDAQAYSQSANATLNVQAATTSFLGRTVVDDTAETSLAGITVTFTGKDDKGNVTGCSGKTTSDGGGNFMLANLPAACVGPQLISYDGTTATSPTGIYAGVSLSYTLVAGQVVSSPVLVHLPRIDNAETVQVQQNSATDQIFNFHTLPGVKVTVYAGTTLTLADGTQPNPFPFVAISIPLDRLPEKIPTTGMLMPFIVAFQPANAVASQPVAVNFPNFLQIAPGTNVTLVTLDPTHGYMVPYGTATVSQDGSQFVANNDPSHPGHGYGLVHFDWHGPMNPPGPGPFPNCCDPNNQPTPTGGDPVDLATGLFTFRKTDLAFRSAFGNTVFDRMYRSGSTNPGPFGFGTSHSFNYMLDTSVYVRGGSVVKLIMPNSTQISYAEQKSGSFTNTANPGQLGDVITTTDNKSYVLRTKNGSTFRFDVSQLGSLLAFLTSITDPNGNTTTLTRSSTDPYQLTQIKDPLGRTFTLVYDGNDHVTQLSDSTGRSLTYTYDNNGNLASASDAAGHVTAYTYDSLANMLTVVDPRGATMVTNVYGAGKVVQQTDAGGGVTTFAYQILNNTIIGTGQSGVQTFTSAGALETTVTDPLGRTSLSRFTTAGQLIATVNPLGQGVSMTLDPQTNLITQVKDSLGRELDSTYDSYGNTIRTVHLANSPSAYTIDLTYDYGSNAPVTISDPSGNITHFSTDSAGNLLSIVDPVGNKQTYTYDGQGELTSYTDAGGNTITVTNANGNIASTTDAAGHVQHRGYDAQGRLTSLTDSLGRVTTYRYNAVDQIVARIDPKGGETDLTYDNNGNVLSVTDPDKNTTRFVYDALNRRTQRIDALGHADTYAYDAVGNLTRYTDRRGVSMTFTYDVMNRVVTAALGGESAIQYTYDAAGRLTTVADSSTGTIVHHFDLRDNATQEITPNGTVTYTYDANGHKTSVQAGNGTPAVYTYDAAGRVLQIAQGSNIVTYTYDSAGRRNTITLPNGVTRTYAFDPSSNVTGITYAGNGKTLGNLAYSHDPSGLVNGVSGSLAATVVPPAAAGYTYNANNQLTSTATASMTYDANGNVTSDGTNTYTWNARNQLASIGPGKATFAYDPFGRRVGKVIGGVSTGYLYDGQNPVQELTNGGVSANLLNGLLGDEFLARTDASGTQSVLTDLTNSTIGVTDSSGNLTSTYTYGPFGTVQTTGNKLTPYQYTGRENDGTGLYYYRARYYNPTLKRFLSEDPAEFAGGVNRYVYAADDPVDNTDPSGKFVQVVVGAGIGFVSDAASQYAVYLLTRKAGQPFSFDVCESAIATGLGALTAGASAFTSSAIEGSSAAAIGLRTGFNTVAGAAANAGQTRALNGLEGQNSDVAFSLVSGGVSAGLGAGLGDSFTGNDANAANAITGFGLGVPNNVIQPTPAPGPPKTPDQSIASKLCHVP